MFSFLKRVRDTRRELREAEHLERMISLYEKQMRTLEELGTKYLFHPQNQARHRYADYRPQTSSTYWFQPPKLRVVK